MKISRRQLAVGLLGAAAARAEDARQIIEESQRRRRVNSEHYEGLLEVVSPNSKIAKKSWEYSRLGSFGDRKAIIRFTSPAEVKGVALLVLNHPDRSSDQWVWTPAINRDRRIALQDRSTRFFGTDFSFEDLEERDVNQYDHNLAGEEAIDGALCWRIDARARQAETSQYSFTRIWVRKDNYVVVKYENFTKDQLARRLHETDLEENAGHLRAAAARNDRRAAQQRHPPAYHETGIQRQVERRRLHRAGASAGTMRLYLLLALTGIAVAQDFTPAGVSGCDRRGLSANGSQYLAQLERQSGEWSFVGGYAGRIDPVWPCLSPTRTCGALV
jgi:hypothetical protein